MRRQINFYLDESGNLKSKFFVVGGFYLIEDSLLDFQSQELKIKSNILKIEKTIKTYRYEKEQNLDQYNVTQPIKYHKEVKWSNLSNDNRKFLLENIKDNKQTNISIISNLEIWQTKTNNLPSIDAIYNMMVFYLIERTLKNLDYKYSDEISICIKLDQRKIVPKIKNSNDLFNRNSKLDSLEEYLNHEFKKENYLNTTVVTQQFSSDTNTSIRYADYYVGLIASMCRYLSNSDRPWDQLAKVFFDTIHNKILCFCSGAIKNQCEHINSLCDRCKNFRMNKLMR
jgi:hypothetical protein